MFNLYVSPGRNLFKQFALFKKDALFVVERRRGRTARVCSQKYESTTKRREITAKRGQMKKETKLPQNAKMSTKGG